MSDKEDLWKVVNAARASGHRNFANHLEKLIVTKEENCNEVPPPFADVNFDLGYHKGKSPCTWKSLINLSEEELHKHFAEFSCDSDNCIPCRYTNFLIGELRKARKTIIIFKQNRFRSLLDLENGVRKLKEQDL